MRGRLRTRFVLFIAAIVLCAVRESPVLQAQAGYRAVVRSAIDGDTKAAAAMAQLPREAVEAGLVACLGRDNGLPFCQPNELKTAAMLHADAIDFLVYRDPSRAAFHLRAGSRMLRPLERLDDVFVARWYAYVARIYLANRDLQSARSVVTDALSKFESPDLYVARGVITERRALGSIPDILGAMLERRLDLGMIPNMLSSAMADYLYALSLDPAHNAARLRLMWIRLLQRDGRAWSDAGDVIAASTDSEARYLARLFRGTIAERDRTLEEAIRDYEEARHEDVDPQTACAALSHAYGQAVDFSRSASIAAECLMHEEDPDVMDPWWPFRVGLMDLTTTKWLHDYALQP